MTDFTNSLKIAATGLHAQSARMRIIAENMANASSAAKEAGGDRIVVVSRLLRPFTTVNLQRTKSKLAR